MKRQNIVELFQSSTDVEFAVSAFIGGRGDGAYYNIKPVNSVSLSATIIGFDFQGRKVSYRV